MSKGQIYLGIEFVLLFFGIPTWIYLDQDFIHPSIIILPVLVLIFIYAPCLSQSHIHDSCLVGLGQYFCLDMPT